MVSVQSTGAYRPSALLVNTAGSSGVFEPRKLCMYSFSRFQQSPGITQAQYSTCGHTNTITAPYHASLKVRSHQTRMKRYARMIYMLSQCKDAIDNPAALFARMRRLTRELKNLNFGGYSRRVNQSGACSSSDVITSGGRKSQTTMEDCSEFHVRMKLIGLFLVEISQLFI